MRILVLNWQDLKNPFAGGAEVHLHEIFRRLVARGHEVTLFCSSFAGALDEETVDGIHVKRKGGRSLFNYIVPLEYYLRFRQERYDIVVDDMNKIPFFTPWFVKEPLLAIAHHFFGATIFREASPLAASYVYAAERLARSAYRKTPTAVVSKSTKQELLAYGFEEENLFFVENAVDHEKHRPLGTPPSTAPLIGYVGRVKKYKSIDHLLRAFKIVRATKPDVRLAIVGDGDSRASLEELARSLQVNDAVTFTGYLPLEEKVKLINQMYLVVNTSSKEGWGLTVTETNACGVPVIASNVPGLRDAVIDGTTGWLYEYGNIQELASKMILLLDNPRQRSEFAAAGLRYAKTFSWESSADTMVQALRTVIERRKQ
jgi:glycosyltransferase involved in cell wall biosynthesis